jgi:hypothetical protein
VDTKLLDPLRACVKVADYCDPSSVGTLTRVKSLEMFVRVLVPPYPNDSQYQIISFCFGGND